MAINPAALARAYEAVEPQLEELRDGMVAKLESIAEQLGIDHPRIDGRVKTLDSLLLKACRREWENRPWSNPMREASDKVGLRVDVVYLEDVGRLVEAIEQASLWQMPPEIDNKADALGVDKLGYQGVHIDVLPVDLPEGLDASIAKCEIQVRTNAQSAWAMGVHDLTYKGVPVDDALRRKVNRLTVLLELVDKGIEEARDAILNGEEYPVAQLVAELRRLRVRFTTEATDEALTSEVVRALVDAADARDVQEQLQDFVQREKSRLGDVLTRPAQAMARQPEALLVYMWLEDNPFALQDRWAEAGFPNSILEMLAAEWGVTLPAPL